MKFDHTFIAIRQRGMLDILDLALHVCRDYLAPLLLLLLVGALPWIALDWLLIGWMVSEAYSDLYSRTYFWLTLVLTLSQAQVGTGMMTHYLGQAMFIGKPDIWASIKAMWRVPFSYYWLHFILRMVLPIAWLTYLFSVENSTDGQAAIGTFLAILLFIGLMVRSVRPFVTKIIVLEKAPWRAAAGGGINYGKRSRSLHSGGELFGRSLVAVLFVTALTLGLFGLISTLHSWLGFKVGLGFVEKVIFWPLSLWLAAGFLAVVRFLSYIDLRIRQEGWEVELSIKAEAVRMQQGGSV